MRSYKRNSPQAAARLVALTLAADGHVSEIELNVLERVGAYEQLGLDRDEMLGVLQGFCEDLLQARPLHWANACQIEPGTLTQMMAEIEDPALRIVVLRLCVAVVEADGHVADGELIALESAAEQWGLQHQMLRPAGADNTRQIHSKNRSWSF